MSAKERTGMRNYYGIPSKGRGGREGERRGEERRGSSPCSGASCWLVRPASVRVMSQGCSEVAERARWRQRESTYCTKAWSCKGERHLARESAAVNPHLGGGEI